MLGQVAIFYFTRGGVEDERLRQGMRKAGFDKREGGHGSAGAGSEEHEIGALKARMGVHEFVP